MRRIMMSVILLLSVLAATRMPALSDAASAGDVGTSPQLTTTPTRTATPSPTPTQSAYNRVYLSVEPGGPPRQQFPANADGVYTGSLAVNFHYTVSGPPVGIQILTRDQAGRAVELACFRLHHGSGWESCVFQNANVPADGSPYFTQMYVSGQGGPLGTWEWAVGSSVSFEQPSYRGVEPPPVVVVTDTVAAAVYPDRDYVEADVVSSSDPYPETFRLTQVTSSVPGTYRGSIDLCMGCPVHNPSVRVSDGDTITVTYTLAGAGDGQVQTTAVWYAPPTPTATATSTASPTPTVTPTSTASPTRTVTPTRTATPSRTPTRTATATSGPGASSTPTRTATAGPSSTPTRTATAGPSPTATNTPSGSPTAVSATVVVTPRADAVGYFRSNDVVIPGGNRMAGTEIWAGYWKTVDYEYFYDGAVQFELPAEIPSQAIVESAVVTVKGKSTSYLKPEGDWALQLLAPDIDPAWGPTLTFTDIHTAPVLFDVPPILASNQLGVDVTNTFTFTASQLPAVETRLATTRRLSFRLVGPTTALGVNYLNVFRWYTGLYTAGAPEPPRLVLTYRVEPPTSTPTSTPSRTPTSTLTWTPTPTPTQTSTPSPTPTRTETATPTVSPTVTPTATPPLWISFDRPVYYTLDAVAQITVVDATLLDAWVYVQSETDPTEIKLPLVASGTPGMRVASLRFKTGSSDEPAGRVGVADGAHIRARYNGTFAEASWGAQQPTNTPTSTPTQTLTSTPTSTPTQTFTPTPTSTPPESVAFDRDTYVGANAQAVLTVVDTARAGSVPPTVVVKVTSQSDLYGITVVLTEIEGTGSFSTWYTLDDQGQPKHLRFSQAGSNEATATIKVMNGDWVRVVYYTASSGERSATAVWLDGETRTPTPTHTAAATLTPSATTSGTPSATPSNTPSTTPSATASTTPSITPSGTSSLTPSVTPTGTRLPTETPTATPTGYLGDYGCVGGIVYDARGGLEAPIAGASVSWVHTSTLGLGVVSGTTTTDSQGRYLVQLSRAHENDMVSLTASAQGYHPTGVTLHPAFCAAGNPRPINLELIPLETPTSTPTLEPGVTPSATASRTPTATPSATASPGTPTPTATPKPAELTPTSTATPTTSPTPAFQVYLPIVLRDSSPPNSATWYRPRRR